MQPAPASRKRILVVDQNTDSALRLADWIAADGYEAIIAPQVSEALELLNRIEPDAILLDLHLQVMSGMEMLRLIRTGYPRLPVITMTDLTFHNLAIRSTKAGASAFLLKPLDRYHVSALLRAEIQRSSLPQQGGRSTVVPQQSLAATG
jgi:DNA-binding response OmpR family regulator